MRLTRELLFQARVLAEVNQTVAAHQIKRQQTDISRFEIGVDELSDDEKNALIEFYQQSVTQGALLIAKEFSPEVFALLHLNV